MQRIGKLAYFGLILSILLLVATSGVWASVNAASGFVEVDVPVRGTYLYPDPQNTAVIEPPGIADLQSNGFSEGDRILITFEGSIDVYGGSDYVPVTALWGVFSSTNELLPVSEADRVPGAIDAGVDTDTGETWFSHENTNIPEDFEISPSTGFSIEIPQNAKYLFISVRDSWYADNTSPAPIHVSIEKQASETAGGFPLEYILAALGIIAVVAVIVVFLALKRRKPKTQSSS
jgi:hypothetical protein